jgi:transformation/transcription domain-associated protein
MRRHLKCRYFYPKLDQLLVEETLVGCSAACREALRPLALSMLAELIHHVRTQLKYPQLVTIIHTFSRCAAPLTLCQ